MLRDSRAGPPRRCLGPRFQILAFDVDGCELAELLLCLRRTDSIDVLEERSLHAALERLATRRIDLLILDGRRSPDAVLARVAAGATRARRRVASRVVLADRPLPALSARLQRWIDSRLAPAAEGLGRDR